MSVNKLRNEGASMHLLVLSAELRQDKTRLSSCWHTAIVEHLLEPGKLKLYMNRASRPGHTYLPRYHKLPHFPLNNCLLVCAQNL